MNLPLTIAGLILIGIGHLAFYRLAYRRGARAVLDHADVLKLLADAMRYRELRNHLGGVRGLRGDALDDHCDTSMALRDLMDPSMMGDLTSRKDKKP